MSSVIGSNSASEMTTASISNSLEVFESSYTGRDDKDSDEESFHLPLEDEEVEQKNCKSSMSDESEEDILNKFASLEENEETEKTPDESTTALCGKKGKNDNVNEECNNKEDDNLQIKEKDETTIKETTIQVQTQEEQDKCEDEPIEEQLKALRDEFKKPEPIMETNIESTNTLAKIDESKPESTDDLSDDLLDISMIRDADQDNADSQAQLMEDGDSRSNTEDKADLEEKNNDFDEEMESDNKSEGDGQSPNHVDETMQIDEPELAIANTTELIISDSATQTISEENQILNEVNDQDSNDKSSEANHKSCDSLVSETDVISERVKVDKVIVPEEISEESLDKKIEDASTTNRSSLKRAISDDLEADHAKKTRLTDDLNQQEDQIEKVGEKSPKKTGKLTSLFSLSEFMKSKKNYPAKKLTISDLEEFCIQKICEVVTDRSEVGEVDHMIKQQEQLIESMRKEILNLTKQAHDLEVVNRKLMSDLKAQSQNGKPLNPLKITRSVGLQVKFTVYDVKKRGPQGSQAGSVLFKSTPQTKVVRSNSMNTSSTPVKAASKPPTTPKQAQIAPKPAPTQVNQTAIQPKPVVNPILNQMLQVPKMQTVAKQVAVALPQSLTKATQSTALVPQKQVGAVSSSVIDLTDEDDKSKPNPLASPHQNGKLIPLRLNTSGSNIRLATTSSSGKGTSVVTTTTPQYMYVVQQSNGQNSGPKTVLLNFQGPNGVITSTVNGSVIAAKPQSIQMKQIQSSTLMKRATRHPAPLPSTPAITTPSVGLKPVPPRPYLTIKKTDTGIILQWRMPYELEMYESIASYQLYAYQETSQTPSSEMWRKVGDVKALALPMACTLTQFADNNTYYFAVRPVDVHKRIGGFSEPEEISL